MKYEVFVTRLAEAELTEARSYIAAEAPAEARRWMADITRKLKSLERYPRRCGRSPEAKDGEELRQLVVGLFRIVILVEESSVYVLNVRRSARLPISRRELKRRLMDQRPQRFKNRHQIHS